MSTYELMDILKKIFCSCHRCIKYYIQHDKNPIQFDQPVTQNLSHIDFEKNRKQDDDNIDIDDVKETVLTRSKLVYGQFHNFVNYFAEIGGFEAIIDFLKYETENQDDKIPLDMITLLTLPFRNCNEIFSPTFAQNFVKSVKEIIINRLNNMSEKELKEIDKETVGHILYNLKDFLTLALSE